MNKDVTVFVSDLNNNTETTKKYGILHYASVIARMR